MIIISLNWTKVVGAVLAAAAAAEAMINVSSFVGDGSGRATDTTTKKKTSSSSSSSLVHEMEPREKKEDQFGRSFACSLASVE